MKIIIYAILIAFVLNLIWEYFHYRLYNDLSGISKHKHLWLATFTDTIIIGIIFGIVSLINKDVNWILNTRPLDFFIIIILGLVVAIFIEIRALKIKRWSYKKKMPTIFGIGLSPLLQLAFTSLLSLIIARFISTQLH